jgi:hypothetical protein
MWLFFLAFGVIVIVVFVAIAFVAVAKALWERRNEFHFRDIIPLVPIVLIGLIFSAAMALSHN